MRRFISCSGSEQLVYTRGSVSSRIAVASPGEAFKEVMPSVADSFTVDHSGILFNAGPDVDRKDFYIYILFLLRIIINISV